MRAFWKRELTLRAKCPLHSGTLSCGGLIETVETQRLEINKLKEENNFLKTKRARSRHNLTPAAFALALSG
jgi:hypothetical protein